VGSSLGPLAVGGLYLKTKRNTSYKIPVLSFRLIFEKKLRIRQPEGTLLSYPK